MINILSIFKRITVITFLCASILVGTPGMSPSFNTHMQIISINGSGWVTPWGKDQKIQAKAGDYLNPGDTIEVLEGNYMQVGFDPNSDNVVHIDGEALATLDHASVLQLDLKKGQVYGLLDDPEFGPRMEIITSHSVTTAKESYFKINANDNATQATSYKGQMRVFNKDQNGRTLLSSVAVRPTESVMIKKNARRFVKLPRIKEKKFNEINKIIKLFDKPREILNYRRILEKLQISDAIDFATEQVDYKPSYATTKEVYKEQDIIKILKGKTHDDDDEVMTYQDGGMSSQDAGQYKRNKKGKFYGAHSTREGKSGHFYKKPTVDDKDL